MIRCRPGIPFHLRKSPPTKIITSTYLPSDNPTSLIAWFRKGVGVTSSGGFASKWADQSGHGNDLSQSTGTLQPAYDGVSVLTFDGISQFMKTLAFTLNQPSTVSASIKIVAWTGNNRIWDGFANDSMELIEAKTGGGGVSPAITMYATGYGPDDLTNATVGAFHAVSAVYNGALNSSIQVDNNSASTDGSLGAGNGGGFTLGARADGGIPANIAVKEIIIRNVNDSTIRANDQAYLQTL